ncbi:15179_t:CDS:1, partial [Acaulospora colombiana]
GNTCGGEERPSEKHEAVDIRTEHHSPDRQEHHREGKEHDHSDTRFPSG